MLALFACAPAFQPSVTLSDPKGDDYGPGEYRYPSDRLHAPGSYDLIQVKAGADQKEVIVQVEIRGSFQSAAGQDAGRYNSTKGLPPSARPTDGTEGYTLQNIEIYLDIDEDPSTGEHRALPGRGVTLINGWEKAIWLSPNPLRARTELARREPNLAKRVIIPTKLSTRGHTLEARFALSELGEVPKASWGYTVFLTGAVSDDSYGGKDGFFVRAVSATADNDTFKGQGVPVIDVWVPKEGKPSQEELLQKKAPSLPSRRGDGSLVKAKEQPEPLALPESAPSSQPTTQKSPESTPTQKQTTIVDHKGVIVTLKAIPGVSVGNLGELVGHPGVYLVITDILGEIMLAKLLQPEAEALLQPGARINF